MAKGPVVDIADIEDIAEIVDTRKRTVEIASCNIRTFPGITTQGEFMTSYLSIGFPGELLIIEKRTSCGYL